MSTTHLTNNTILVGIGMVRTRGGQRGGEDERG